MFAYPFVKDKMKPTGNIGSTPVIILGNDTYTCLLAGVGLTNLTDNPIVVTLAVAREETIGTETYFTYVNKLSIQPNDRVDILLNAALTLEPGDLLYASSDYSTSLFNSFVSYREQSESTPTPPLR